VIRACAPILDRERLRVLLGRGFLLSQAVDRWQSRGIWVAGRGDPEYPARLRERLKGAAPPVIYGRGERAILGPLALAVVGSRDPDDGVLEQTSAIGRLTVEAGIVLVSGGARGVDEAGKQGALEAGGMVVCVLSDSLEKRALQRDNRQYLKDGRLLLISPYDPLAGFNVGHAMQRNKAIYALSDAALVMNSDYNRGGTWTGAVEQLEKLKLVPVYVRADGVEAGTALHELRRRGALIWPNPETPRELLDLITGQVQELSRVNQVEQLPLTGIAEGYRPG
jgi:DNA processing protein